MMTAFQGITKSTTEHLGAARFNRPPLPAKRHGFSPPFTICDARAFRILSPKHVDSHREADKHKRQQPEVERAKVTIHGGLLR